MYTYGCHGDVWQKPIQYYKVIILQLKIDKFLKREEEGKNQFKNLAGFMLGLHHYEFSQLRAIRSTILIGSGIQSREVRMPRKDHDFQLYMKVHNFRRERGQRMAAENQARVSQSEVIRAMAQNTLGVSDQNL